MENIVLSHEEYTELNNKVLSLQSQLHIEERQNEMLIQECEYLKSQLAKAEADKRELLNLISRLDDYFFCEKQLEEGEYEDLMNSTHKAINKHGNNK